MKSDIVNNNKPLRKRAEELISADAASADDMHELKDIIHEFHVYQAELELQNEELQLLQSKIEASRNKYYELFNNAPVGYIIIDADYRIKEINSTALQLLNKKRSEITGQPILQSIETGNHSRMVSFLKIIAGSDERHEIIVHLKNNGHQKLIVRIDAVRSEAIREDQQRHLLIITDLTELHLAQNELKKSETLFRSLVESSDDHIFLLNCDHEFITSNDVVEYLGYSSGKELSGKPCSKIFPSNISELFEKNYNTVLTSSSPVFFDYSLSRNGTTTHHHCKLYPISDGSRLTAVGGISRDISQLKKIQQENEEMLVNIRQKQKLESLGTLAGGIAHDFNNILSSILGFTELSLPEAEKGSELEDNLLEVLQGGIRAKNLVKQILTYARKSQENKEYILLGTVIEEVIRFLRPSIPANIEINYKQDGDFIIHGNTNQVHQVMMNLCSNAAHAMKENGGVIDISLSAGADPDSYPDCKIAEIEIADTGEGIQPEFMEKVFDPYFTTKEMGTGTGLGLSVVEGIIKSYDGNISLVSEPGKGTRVTVQLPISENSRPENLVLLADEDQQYGNSRILFVDDEQSIAQLNKQLLQRIGHDVTIFTDSNKALDAFTMAPEDYDLVISDVTMPGMCGDELARKILAIRDDIPIILCTGYSRKNIAEQVKGLGIKALLQKPVKNKTMVQTIQTVLEKTSDSV